MGESDKPLLRYSTSEMARDAIELLDHLRWTGKRELHVIGPSMGGMIAQELVRLPEHLSPSQRLPRLRRLVSASLRGRHSSLGTPHPGADCVLDAVIDGGTDREHGGKRSRSCCSRA